MTIVGAFGNSKSKAHAKRAQLQRGKFRPRKPTPSATKSPQKINPEPCYDSDWSDYYKPSNIIAKIHKEQEAEDKKRKWGEIVENLPCYPLCWLSLGIISMESKAHVKAMPPGEQIYNRVYASLVDQGVINSDNDPESENWVDPRSVHICENCGKPHVDATKRTCKLVLMQCYAEFDKPRRMFGCRKWFHIGCIGRKVVPDKAAVGSAAGTASIP